MKKHHISLLIIGILLATSFGLVIMSHQMNFHDQCPFETARVTDCMAAQNALSFVISHLSAVSKFFSAIPVALAMSFLLLLSFMIFLELGGARLFIRHKIFKKSSESFTVPPDLALIHWLSLHENSPSFSAGRWR